MKEIVSKTIELFLEEFENKSSKGVIKKVSVTVKDDAANILIVALSENKDINFATLEIKSEEAYLYRVRDLVNNLLAQVDVEPMTNNIYTDDINRKIDRLAAEIDEIRNQLTTIK